MGAEAPFGDDAVRVAVRAAQGGMEFVPSGSNAPGVVTELLVQTLDSRHRATYASKYRSRGYGALAGAPVLLRADAGWVACAVRFVRAAAGQAGPLLQLGRVRVDA